MDLRYLVCPSCGRLVSYGQSFCPNRTCRAPLFELSEPPIVRGELKLGFLRDGTEVSMPLNWLSYHVAIYGVTGMGKTRLAMKLALEAEKRGIKLLVLDVEGEWKNLLPMLNAKAEYYEACNNLKVNPFDLGDKGMVKALLKETVFSGIEVEYRELSPQMNYVLNRCIEEARSIPELIDKVVGFEPDVPFKFSNLDRTKTALIVRLHPFESNPMLREVFYVNSSNPELSNLGDKNILFDLHRLEARVVYRNELRLVYNTIAIAYLRQALERELTNEVRHMLIVDEAQLLIPKILRKATTADTWASTHFATRLRKRGECLVLITQSPSNIEDDVRRNCQNMFAFKLQDANDAKLIAGLLGWSDPSQVEYLSNRLISLGNGMAFVKLSGLKVPFIMRAARFDVKRVSGKELRRFIRHSMDLDELEEMFLQSLVRKPFLPSARRREWLGFSKEEYSKVVESLISKGIIERVSVSMGKGRPIVLYQVKGRRPSVKHEYYVYWLLDKLTSKGLVCRLARIGEAKPDIWVPKLSLAINVELGKSNIEENVERALKEFKRVIVCSDDRKVLERIRQKFNDGRVTMCYVWECLKELERSKSSITTN